jgi:hypothetical protein
MHLAHSTSDPPALRFGGVAPLDLDVVALRDDELVAVAVLAGLDVVEAVELLTDATPEPSEPPPQPATRATLANVVAANTGARDQRNNRVGPIIWTSL